MILSWNGGAEALLDYLAEDVIGKDVSIFIPPERQSLMDLCTTRVSQGEVIRNYEGLGKIPQDFCSRTQGMSGRDLSQLAARIVRAAFPSQPGRVYFMTMLDATRKKGNTEVDTQARWGA